MAVIKVKKISEMYTHTCERPMHLMTLKLEFVGIDEVVIQGKRSAAQLVIV